MSEVKMVHIPITLGHWYRDMVTGYTGVAVRYDVDVDGCAHVHLQKQVGNDGEKDGKFEAGVIFLANRMEIVAGEGYEPLPMTRETQTASPVVLGRKYRDSITGFEGVATSRTEALEGYIHVILDAGVDKKKKMGERFSFDESRMIDVETGRAIGSPAPSGCDRFSVPR